MTARARASPPHGGDRGIALLAALLLIAIVTVVAGALVVSSTADTLIAGTFRASQESLYAADAGLQRSIGELSLLPGWSSVLAKPPASLVASFDDGTAAVLAPDGRALNATRLTQGRQAASDTGYGLSLFGADRPQWRLYAHAPLGSLLRPGLAAPPAYVLVWVADDGEDGDGDPSRDSNGQILLHAEAYGVSGARRGVDASIRRVGVAAAQLISWKDMR